MPGASVSKIGIEVFDHVLLAADHHAVPAFEPPHAAAGADIDIVNLLRREFFRAADVVDVVGIAAVDEDVARFEMRAADRRWSCP